MRFSVAAPAGPLPIAVACPVALIATGDVGYCWLACASVGARARVEIARNNVTNAVFCVSLGCISSAPSFAETYINVRDLKR